MLLVKSYSTVFKRLFTNINFDKYIKQIEITTEILFYWSLRETCESDLLSLLSYLAFGGLSPSFLLINFHLKNYIILF